MPRRDRRPGILVPDANRAFHGPHGGASGDAAEIAAERALDEHAAYPITCLRCVLGRKHEHAGKQVCPSLACAACSGGVPIRQGEIVEQALAEFVAEGFALMLI